MSRQINLLNDLFSMSSGSALLDKTVVFMRNENEKHQIVSVNNNGTITKPSDPVPPSGFNFFEGWYDGQTKISFPYQPPGNKSLMAHYYNLKKLPAKITNFIAPNIDDFSSDIEVNRNPFSQTTGFEERTEENGHFYRILQGNNILSYYHDFTLDYRSENYGFSMGGWFRLPALTNTWQDMFCIGNDGSGFKGLDIYAAENKIHIDGTSSSMLLVTPSAVFEDNSWFHLALVVNSAGCLNLYINGVSVLTAENCSMVQNYTYPLKIGSAPWGGSIKNYMDITQFFSSPQALTAEEVQTLYGYFG